MLKKTIKLNEARLKKIISESVKRVLDEAVEVNPEASKWPNGVNPEAAKRWQEEDHEERVRAVNELYNALWQLEELYEVQSESDHPLEKAYDLIWDWAEGEGLNPE